MAKIVVNAWVLVRRAADLPGIWIAHCLEFDVVTQGTSLVHAIDMAFEAVSLTIQDDMEAGRHPLNRRRAPKEYWDDLWKIVNTGNAASETKKSLAAKESTLEAIAAQFVVSFVSEKSKLNVPLLFEKPGPLTLPATA